MRLIETKKEGDLTTRTYKGRSDWKFMPGQLDFLHSKGWFVLSLKRDEVSTILEIAKREK